jgi:ribose transport system substrate-binding protein
MMKKLLKIVSVTLMLALSLVMMSSCANNTPSKSGSVAKSLKIFETCAFYTAPYCAAQNTYMMSYAKKIGVDLQIVDGQQNAGKQLEQLKTAVAQKVDGIILFPSDVTSTPELINYLNSSKVPYIVINTPVDDSVKSLVPCYVGTDVIQHGYNIASMLTEALPNGGNIVEVMGNAGSSFTIGVDNGITEKIKGTNITMLAKQNADFDAAKAMKVTQDFLTKYGDKINVIVSQDGGMLSGVISALKAANETGKIKVVCAGSNKAVYDSLMDDSLFGTSTQDPSDEGKSGIDSLVNLINGKKVDSWVKVPIVPCKKADVGQHNWF